MDRQPGRSSLQQVLAWRLVFFLEHRVKNYGYVGGKAPKIFSFNQTAEVGLTFGLRIRRVFLIYLWPGALRRLNLNEFYIPSSLSAHLRVGVQRVVRFSKLLRRP